MYLVRKQFRSSSGAQPVVACTPTMERARALAEAALARDPQQYAVYELVWVGCNFLMELPTADSLVPKGVISEVVLLRLFRVPAGQGALPHRWETWQNMKEPDKNPAAEFAYRLLAEDPMALDVWQDVVARGW